MFKGSEERYRRDLSKVSLDKSDNKAELSPRQPRERI